MILERLEHHSVTDASHHSVDNVVRKQPHEAAAGIHPPVIQDLRKHQGKQVIQKPNVHHITDLHEEHHDAKILTPRDRHPTPKLSLKDLSTDEGHRKRPVARGVAGLPLDQTPAVVGAQRAHIHCDINVDSVAYWNDPQGTRDGNFVSPFSVHQERYITFTSDRGGWNNVRMSMEIIFILAAATNRTLVLPPKEPLYLLAKGKERHKGFADFFPLTTPAFQKKVRTITTLEFLEREGPEGTGRLQLGEHAESIMAAAEFCDFRAASEHSCGPLREFLNHAGTTVNVSATRSCIVFDEGVYSNNSAVDPGSLQNLKAHCGTSRELHYWQASRYEDPLVLHFPAGEREYRLLAHFYGSIYFTNPSIDHYYKRFVRDFLHYHDAIWCAAGKIVKALQVEASRRGFQPNDEGAGGYSALHVRRGDLQYKKVKIPAQEWYDNTKHVWLKNELLYVATDERNKVCRRNYRVFQVSFLRSLAGNRASLMIWRCIMTCDTLTTTGSWPISVVWTATTWA